MILHGGSSLYNLRQQVLEVLKSGKVDAYCHFHHHGPFFPGFVAAFLDFVAADISENADEVRRLREFLATRLGEYECFLRGLWLQWATHRQSASGCYCGI